MGGGKATDDESKGIKAALSLVGFFGTRLVDKTATDLLDELDARESRWSLALVEQFLDRLGEEISAAGRNAENERKKFEEAKSADVEKRKLMVAVHGPLYNGHLIAQTQLEGVRDAYLRAKDRGKIRTKKDAFKFLRRKLLDVKERWNPEKARLGE